MKLIIHRGAQGIEGNCIEISTSTTRIILDAGLPLDDLGDSPRPRPRPGKALPAGLAPIVPGLFGPGPKVDAILLSHAHADHAGLLAFARKGIPILMSDGTRMMLKAASIFAGQPPLPQDQLRIVGHRERFVIGDLTITAFPVDHSTFDCLAFVIDGDEKRVVYSGDLRLHGRKPGMAKRLLAALKERPVDVLLMEGTNIISEGRGPTEVELEAELLDHIKSATRLVLASFSPLHVDRMVSFYKATRRAGRTLVVDLYGAFVLHLVNKRASIPRPGIRNGILVCYNAPASHDPAFAMASWSATTNISSGPGNVATWRRFMTCFSGSASTSKRFLPNPTASSSSFDRVCWTWISVVGSRLLGASTLTGMAICRSQSGGALNLL